MRYLRRRSSRGDGGQSFTNRKPRFAFLLSVRCQFESRWIVWDRKAWGFAGGNVRNSMGTGPDSVAPIFHILEARANKRLFFNKRTFVRDTFFRHNQKGICQPSIQLRSQKNLLWSR